MEKIFKKGHGNYDGTQKNQCLYFPTFNNDSAEIIIKMKFQ